MGFFKKKPEAGPGRVLVKTRPEPVPDPTRLDIFKITKKPTYI